MHIKMTGLKLTITITTLNIYGLNIPIKCRKKSKTQLDDINKKHTLSIKTQIGQENGDVENVNMGQKNDYISIK